MHTRLYRHHFPRLAAAALGTRGLPAPKSPPAWPTTPPAPGSSSSPQILSASGDWERVVLLDNPTWPDYAPQSLAEIGRRRGQDPHDAALDLLARRRR